MHFVWKEWRHDYWFVWTTSILFNQINCHVKIISFLFTMIAMFRDVFYWLYKANILQTMHGKIIFSAWNRIKKNLSSISGVAVSKKSGRSFIVIWELVPIQLQLGSNRFWKVGLRLLSLIFWTSEMAQIPLRKWSEFSLSNFSTRFGFSVTRVPITPLDNYSSFLDVNHHEKFCLHRKSLIKVNHYCKYLKKNLNHLNWNISSDE